MQASVRGCQRESRKEAGRGNQPRAMSSTAFISQFEPSCANRLIMIVFNSPFFLPDPLSSQSFTLCISRRSYFYVAKHPLAVQALYSQLFPNADPDLGKASGLPS